MINKLFGGRKSQRTFKVVNAVNKDGCDTKFRGGRYTGNPSSAAKKAFTKLCNYKDIRGQCSLYITIQETTRGSGKMVNDDKNKKGRVMKKEKIYHIQRVKLDKPIIMFEGKDNEYEIQYGNKIKSVDRVPVCKVKRVRTRGVMKKTSRRSNKRRAAKKSSKKKKQLNNNLANNNNYRNNNNQSGGSKKRSLRKRRN